MGADIANQDDFHPTENNICDEIDSSFPKIHCLNQKQMDKRKV